MARTFALIFAFLLAGSLPSHSYDILVVFPTASYSHQLPQIAISKALAAHGHRVTVVSPNPFETSNPNITQISLSFLYGSQGQLLQQEATDQMDVKVPFTAWRDQSGKIMLDIFSNEEVRSLLADESRSFDAVIVETHGYTVTHALALKYDATLIGVTSLPMFPTISMALGNPTHPLVERGWYYTYSQQPGLLERVKMLYDFVAVHEIIDGVHEIQDAALREIFPDVKATSRELLDMVQLAIECVSPAQGQQRPLLPNTKQIGFMHIEPPKALPEDLQGYLDSSKRGVVYFSLGTNVHSAGLGPSLLAPIQKALASLNFDVLWKFENDTMASKPENVRLIKWAPQADLLAHPKVRAFVTQGGAQSVEEAIDRGVPMVIIPFFADQHSNAENSERLGIAKTLQKGELTALKLERAILEVIEKPEYRRRVLQLRQEIRDTPMNATETAVWHIEHAIRNRGADMFDYRGKSVPLYQYLFLDVLGLGCGLVVLVFLAIKFTLARSGGSKIKRE